jgi:hypothetical protein
VDLLGRLEVWDEIRGSLEKSLPVVVITFDVVIAECIGNPEKARGGRRPPPAGRAG